MATAARVHRGQDVLAAGTGVDQRARADVGPDLDRAAAAADGRTAGDADGGRDLRVSWDVRSYGAAGQGADRGICARSAGDCEPAGGGGAGGGVAESAELARGCAGPRAGECG